MLENAAVQHGSANPPDFLCLCLERELERRVNANPRYSLRAFAKVLGISHSMLSLILSRKKTPSSKTVLQIAQALNWSSEEILNVLELSAPAENRDLGNAYEKMSLERFSLLSEWYYYAILSLLELPQAEFTPKWIAKQLNLSELQAKLALQRLIQLRAVTVKKGRWKQASAPIKVENTVSTQATRKFHKQILEKAVESLEKDPIEVRDFSAMTLAMDPKHIPYALARIRKFRRQLTKELEAMGKPKAVYNLAVQIYPVSLIQENP